MLGRVYGNESFSRDTEGHGVPGRVLELTPTLPYPTGHGPMGRHALSTHKCKNALRSSALRFQPHTGNSPARASTRPRNPAFQRVTASMADYAKFDSTNQQLAEPCTVMCRAHAAYGVMN